MSSIVCKDEQVLIQGCVTGEAESWQQFIQRYGRLVHATALAVCRRQNRPTGEAEDLTGHVYEKLLEDQCRRLRLWRGQSRFSTYLVQVTRNLSIDYLKRYGRTTPMTRIRDIRQWFGGEANDCDPEQDCVRKKALREALEHLSPKQAMIIRLRMEGQTLRQIAVLLNVPVGTVSAENSRAMERLRQAMLAADDNQDPHGQRSNMP